MSAHTSYARRPRAFHFSSFRYLFFGRLLTVLGNGIAPIALAFAVLDIGGSATELGLVVAARSVFNVAFLLIGGVLADRYSRSRVLVCSSLVAALAQGIVAWQVLDGSATVALLAVLGAFNGAAAGVALPASSSMVPQTVPVKCLREANAFIQLGVYGGTVIGASLGGVLTSAIGPGWGLAIDALGFAASAPLYLLIRMAPAATKEQQSNLLQDLRDGWREFISRSWVWVVVAQFTLVNAALSGVMMVLGPVVADASFGRTGWGLSVASQSIGLILGSLLALRWRPRRDFFIGVSLVALCALPMLFMSLIPYTPVLMAAFLLAGLSVGLFGVVWAQALQTHIPPEKLARVYAYDAMGSFVAIPVGEIAAGPLAHHYGSAVVLLACAAVVVLATLAASMTPAVRHFSNGPQLRSQA